MILRSFNSRINTAIIKQYHQSATTHAIDDSEDKSPSEGISNQMISQLISLEQT